MLSPRRALVDTAAWYALSDRRDANHAVARTTLQRLYAERWWIMTTNFLLAEAHALHLTRLGRDYAWEFLRRMDESPMAVLRVSEDDERRAREMIDRYTDKAFSLVDATSFAIMERLGIGYAFTVDRHFRQYGFSMLEE